MPPGITTGEEEVPPGVTVDEEEVPPWELPPGITTGEEEVPPGDWVLPPEPWPSPGFTPTRTAEATLGASCLLMEAEGP